MQFFQQFEKVKQINIGYVIRAGVVQIDSDVLPGANWRVRSDWCAASYRHVESESLIVLSVIAANSDCFHINLSNIAYIKHSLWSMGVLCFATEYTGPCLSYLCKLGPPQHKKQKFKLDSNFRKIYACDLWPFVLLHHTKWYQWFDYRNLRLRITWIRTLWIKSGF